MSDRNPTWGLPLFAGVTPPRARRRSKTSIDTATSITQETRGKRREHVYLAIAASSSGLARFQIAERLGVADHWITSSVEALITAKRIKECADRTVINPRSGKRCAVLVVRHDV
jgi:hypothetical protein